MKTDYLKECMNDVSNVPIDEFTQSFCVRCGNENCNRSRLNNSILSNRVKDWKEKLFINVPRMDEENSKNLASKNFLPIEEKLEIRSNSLPVFSTKTVSPIIETLIKQEPINLGIMGKIEEPKITELNTEKHPTTIHPENKGRTANTSFEQGAYLVPVNKTSENKTEPVKEKINKDSSVTFVFEDD